jgi:RecG-like helicase
LAVLKVMNPHRRFSIITTLNDGIKVAEEDLKIKRLWRIYGDAATWVLWILN